MSRDLNKLKPEFLEPLLKTIEACELRGVHMVPYETERTVWQQARLWRKSRSGATIRSKVTWLRANGANYLADVIESVGPQRGGWKTNAIPGLSWHQHGLAADLYWDSNGPEEKGGAEWSDLSGYETFGTVGRSFGLTSGFFWRSRDAVHIQLPSTHKPDGTIQQISDQMEERYGYRN